MIRRTAVCRNVKPGGNPKRADDWVGCKGGGWWGDATPARCPHCKGSLTDLAPTLVLDLHGARQ